MTTEIETAIAIYPEIVGYRARGTVIPSPSFPAACPNPACNAERTCLLVCRLGQYIEARDGATDVQGAEYACGGTYSIKPQIQNHTNYFWGTCGKDAKGGDRK
jgi:hypothetical protein